MFFYSLTITILILTVVFPAASANYPGYGPYNGPGPSPYNGPGPSPYNWPGYYPGYGPYNGPGPSSYNGPDYFPNWGPYNGPGYGPGPSMEDECSVGPALTYCYNDVSINIMHSPVAIATAVCSCALRNPVPLPARCSIADKTMLAVVIRSAASCEAFVVMSEIQSNNNSGGGNDSNDGPPAGCIANCMAGCSANAGSPQSTASTCDCISKTCPSNCNTSQDNAWTLALYSELRANRPFCLELTADESSPPAPQVTCNAGQYLKNKGGSNEVCQTCPAGKFTRTNGNRNKKCPKCPRGTYQPEEGQTTCLMCPKGFRSRGEMGGANCYHKNTGRPFRPFDLLEHPEHPGASPGPGPN